MTILFGKTQMGDKKGKRLCVSNHAVSLCPPCYCPTFYIILSTLLQMSTLLYIIISTLLCMASTRARPRINVAEMNYAISAGKVFDSQIPRTVPRLSAGCLRTVLGMS